MNKKTGEQQFPAVESEKQIKEQKRRSKEISAKIDQAYADDPEDHVYLQDKEDRRIAEESSDPMLKLISKQITMVLMEIAALPGKIEELINAKAPTSISRAGTVLVNHDFGQKDGLRVGRQDGSSVENANIYMYLKEDWEAEKRSSGYCKGWSMTNQEGRWAWSIYLEPGSYIMIVDCPGLLVPPVPLDVA